MSKAPKPTFNLVAEKRALKDFTYEDETIRMYMMTTRPHPMGWKDPFLPADESPVRFMPKKTKAGSIYYEVPVDMFIKLKKGDWDKYHLGTNCYIRISMPTANAGAEEKLVYPVIEQIFPSGDNPRRVEKNYQGLPKLVDVYDDRYQTLVREEFFTEINSKEE